MKLTEKEILPNKADEWRSFPNTRKGKILLLVCQIALCAITAWLTVKIATR